jgi:hypothetical protein
MSPTDMRDLVVTENISLDGVIEPMDGWFDPGATDDDLLAVITRHREAADALALGRVTYQDFLGYWRTRRSCAGRSARRSQRPNAGQARTSSSPAARPSFDPCCRPASWTSTGSSCIPPYRGMDSASSPRRWRPLCT